MAACAEFRSVDDDEQVVRIHMEPGNVIAVPASVIAIE